MIPILVKNGRSGLALVIAGTYTSQYVCHWTARTKLGEKPPAAERLQEEACSAEHSRSHACEFRS